MAPLSLKIVQDDGAVTRKVKLDPNLTVREAHDIIREKANKKDDTEYGLFLKSLENESSGIWMEEHRTLGYYMLRDGDRVDYLNRMRNLRIKMLDGFVKTLQVDQSKVVGDLMVNICARLGITNQEEYGLCLDEDEEAEEYKENMKEGHSGTLRPGHGGTLTRAGYSGTLTAKRNKPSDRDKEFEQLSKRLKTDDNVEWIDAHMTLSEAGVPAQRTVLLKRRLFYSDKNVDSRDPIQLGLLYVQTRNNILEGRHPVTETQAADCKVRWINIRDVHRRILRKRLSRPGQPMRPYKYDKLLRFMKDFYKEVIPANSPTDEEEEDDKGSEMPSEVWNDVVLDCHNESEEEEEEKPLIKPKRTRKRKVGKFEEVNYTTASVTDTLNDPVPDYNVSEPVDAFLLSIGAVLKKFTPYHLNVAKTKIFQIVQEHDLQQIVEKTPGKFDGSGSSDVYYQT